MSFLFLEDSLVKCTDQGMLLPAVKAVYAKDKHSGKPFFNDVITYVFFVYKKDGIYSDSFLEYRKKMVIDRHLPKRRAEDFEKDLRVQALIEEYLERQMTKIERFYYQLELDMENLLKQISSIPYTKTVKIHVPYTSQDGVETKIATTTEIENYEEKSKAIMLADKMVDYADKLKGKIHKENTEKLTGGQARLFDKSSV